MSSSQQLLESETEGLKEPPLEVVSPFVAEFVGTFLLTFTAGVASVTGDGAWTPTAIACVLMVAIYAFGSVSGGHLNPSVSIVCGLARPEANPMTKMAGYIVAQVLAALLAGWLYAEVFDKAVPIGPQPGYGWFQAGIVEVLYTAMLAFVVVNCALSVRNNPAEDQNSFFALAIGFVIVAGGYGGGHVSGGVFNPAVTLGLDVTNKGHTGSQDGIVWRLIYIVYQVLGAGLAAILFHACRFKEGSDRGAEGETLTLRILAAYNLKNREPGSTAEASDPYVVARVGLEQRVTPSIPGELNPRWKSDNIFTFNAQTTARLLELEVMNKSSTGADNTLGTLNVHFDDLPKSVPIKKREKLVVGWDGEIEYELQISGGGGNFRPLLLSRILSEFLGTFMLALTVGLNLITGSAATAMSAGAALMCMIYSLGDVSGGHFNPAVTLAVVLSRRGICSPIDGLAYMVAQLAGGVLAGLLYSNVHATGPNKGVSYSLAPATQPNGVSYSWWQAFSAEIAFTFMLAFVVLAVATTKPVVPEGKERLTRRNFQFALAIGSCVTAGGFAIGSISGGSLNPAVSWGIATASHSNIYSAAAPWYYCLWYSLFELAGGCAAAIIFFITHFHEYTTEVSV